MQQRGLGRRRFRGWRGRQLRRKLPLGARRCMLAAVIAATTLSLLPNFETQSHVLSTRDAQPRPRSLRNKATRRHEQIESETHEIRSGFDQIQNAVSAASASASFLQHGLDAWDLELESIENEIASIEANQTSPGPGEGPGEEF